MGAGRGRARGRGGGGLGGEGGLGRGIRRGGASSTTAASRARAGGPSIEGAEAAALSEEASLLPPGLLAERRWLHEAVFPAVEHIHARIGSSQTPQTPPGEAADPNALRAHVEMWRTVWSHLHRSGAAEALMTPEYGPGYFTGQACVRTEWSAEKLWEQTLAAALLPNAGAAVAAAPKAGGVAAATPPAPAPGPLPAAGGCGTSVIEPSH